ncbi:cell division/cell wall cluster transcriptional repressor MraZ [uncultured Jannaschia sp.]|uniref:division/cell wall cluster transcriptional repressor MraZ n=1 Tax=Jannaschia halovivens TaxID=3388667 RepID=UPI00261E218B|nr:cell division/cell wall cluster transcriptional repressor MraZ [uncultured Jannaschia sp.]
MTLRFRGNSTHKVDGKGRVSIPADFRRVLDAADPDREPGTNARVHVLYGDTRNPWLTCYSVAALAEEDAKIERLPDGHPDREVLEDYFYTFVETLSIDDSGRLVLPRALRDQVGIGDEAVFASKGRTFRILSPQVPEVAANPLKTRLGELPEGFSITRLLPSDTPPAAS